VQAQSADDRSQPVRVRIFGAPPTQWRARRSNRRPTRALAVSSVAIQGQSLGTTAGPFASSSSCRTISVRERPRAISRGADRLRLRHQLLGRETWLTTDSPGQSLLGAQHSTGQRELLALSDPIARRHAHRAAQHGSKPTCAWVGNIEPASDAGRATVAGAMRFFPTPPSRDRAR